MFFQLLFIHLFRPFLKYTQATSPLPSNVSPRKLCTQAAAMISKLMRLYKRSHGLRQIPNIAVYITHSASTIHLLNLPDKNARRDIVHGVKHLEEIAESWLCARRTLAILSVLANKWNVEMPDEAAAVLARTDAKFGSYLGEISSPAGSQRRASEAFTIASQASAPPSQSMQTAAPQQPASGYVPHNQQHQDSVGQNAGASVAARSNSVQYAAPPLDATGLRAQQYPSVTSTPQRWQQGSLAGGSPSDMFGGVEQLLRDSQDWAYRDQAQLATGFDNWNPPMPGAGMEQWTPHANMGMQAPNATAMNGGPVGGGTGMMQQQHQQQAASVSMPPNQNSGMYNAAGGMDSMGMANWLNGMNAYNSMAASYDEDEWYR